MDGRWKNVFAQRGEAGAKVGRKGLARKGQMKTDCEIDCS
jgi:hypothetical protein